MTEVLYRKWRPSTLNDLVGQDHISQTLKHSVDSSRFAHAYLFCGPRGTGKTSTARILAKA
ncbi:MAG: AAA family ATPase, partial [Dehalococcoidia bacterium]